MNNIEKCNKLIDYFIRQDPIDINDEYLPVEFICYQDFLEKIHINRRIRLPTQKVSHHNNPYSVGYGMYLPLLQYIFPDCFVLDNEHMGFIEPGFPDFLVIKNNRMIFVELKIEGEPLLTSQKIWFMHHKNVSPFVLKIPYFREDKEGYFVNKEEPKTDISNFDESIITDLDDIKDEDLPESIETPKVVEPVESVQKEEDDIADVDM